MKDASVHQIRGSSLLLVGRGLSVATNFLTQIILIRYLSTEDFGTWAYALAVVSVLQIPATLGLQTTISRFVPIYYEKREYAKLYGTVMLVLITVLGSTLLLVAALTLLPEATLRRLFSEPRALSLLYILILLVPGQAADALLTSFFATLARPRTLFIRGHVVAPLFRLSIVGALIALNLDVRELAIGYVAATAASVLIFGSMLMLGLKKDGILREFRNSGCKIPAREVLSFSLPVLTSEAVSASTMAAVAVYLLAQLRNPTEAAFFRAATPIANLNQAVINTFAVLYTPLAARMFARNDHAGLNDAFWKAASWMSMLSLPIFLVTVPAAQEVVVALYGSRYAPAAAILAIVSLGAFVNTAAGPNTQTLRVCGDVRALLGLNAVSFVIGIAIMLILLPSQGAIGAALGMMATMVARNILTQLALHRASGLALWNRRYSRLYISLAAALLSAFVVDHLLPIPLAGTVAVAAVATVAVLVFSRRVLRVDETFPELLRVPAVRYVFAVGERVYASVLPVLCKTIDAAATAHLVPQRSLREHAREVVKAYGSKRARIRSATHILNHLGGFGTRIAHSMCRAEHLPISASAIDLLQFGAGATVWRVRRRESPDYVLKIYRLSLGQTLEVGVATAERFRAARRKLEEWYGDMVVPLYLFVSHGPVLGTTAAMGLQPYVANPKWDLFSRYSEDDLCELMVRDDQFRAQLMSFASRTLTACRTEGRCFDLVGTENVVVVKNGQGYAIRIIDYGIFDVQAVKRTSPESFEVLQRRLAMLGRLLTRFDRTIPFSVPTSFAPGMPGATAGSSTT